MGRPISAAIPHNLGEAEARRRIENGFASLEQQMAGSVGGMLRLEQSWQQQRLEFQGSMLGQKLSGRLHVREDVVQIEVDLPEILAAIADQIRARLQRQTQKLLENK